MECAQCGVRSSIGYCHECEILLCEVCGNRCERCHKTVCRSHIQRTSSGRNICVSCVVANYEKRATQSKELRERRAERAEIGRKKKRTRDRDGVQGSPLVSESAPAEESFSFESLVRDDEPVAYRTSAPMESQSLRFESAPLADPDALNKRVLTGSASARKPMWLSGLVLAALSWLLLISALRASEVGAQKAILTLVAFLLSLGTLVWVTPSAISKEGGSARKRSRLVLLIGIAAFLGAVLVYVQRWSELN